MLKIIEIGRLVKVPKQGKKNIFLTKLKKKKLKIKKKLQSTNQRNLLIFFITYHLDWLLSLDLSL